MIAWLGVTVFIVWIVSPLIVNKYHQYIRNSRAFAEEFERMCEMVEEE